VGGGLNNNAGGNYAVVGGGDDNIANDEFTTVAGGVNNTASSYGAMVGGGQNNHATNQFATVAGGFGNTAGGLVSFAAGQGNLALGAYSLAAGYGNTVGGNYSVALGQGGTANDHNAFLWSDGTRAAISQGPDTFAVLATGAGGCGFFVGNNVRVSIGYTSAHDIDVTSGAYLSHAGVWTSVSDRNVKTNFTNVSARDVLERVVAMPVQAWSYNAEDPAIRHIGPMAQDFYAAFKVGDDDKHIGTIDEGGVAFAAIQGLNQKLEQQVKERDARISALERRLADLEATVQKVSAQMERSKAAPIPAANISNHGGL